jgi:hypothetical protein
MLIFGVFLGNFIVFRRAGKMPAILTKTGKMPVLHLTETDEMPVLRESYETGKIPVLHLTEAGKMPVLQDILS